MIDQADTRHQPEVATALIGYGTLANLFIAVLDVIPFANHLCLGAKPQAERTHDKAKQQRNG